MEPVIKQAAVCPLPPVLQSEFFIALGTQDSEAISAFPLSVWQHKVACVVDNTYWGSELFLRMHTVLYGEERQHYFMFECPGEPLSDGVYVFTKRDS